MGITFQTDDHALQRKYESALLGLQANTWKLFGYEEPVLIEGGCYSGIWLECGPLESTVYGMMNPSVALSSHRIFFRHQREDGYIPTTIYKDRYLQSQIQMVVPIAATALETFMKTKDDAFLEEAYAACSRWDAWLGRYRNTRETGLCELFCEYDTGHDNSPRLTGIPHACPEGDARICNPVGTLPYLAPDLSASVYGGRAALAKMAKLLNKNSEADDWNRKAESILRALMAYCFDPEDMFFYDLDSNNRFIRVKGDVLTRVLGEHVVDQTMFEKLFDKHIWNENRFRTPYPLPSIAIDEPAFNHDFRHNAWSGASQALTALRAPRWLEHYGKPAHLTELMKRWVEAIVSDDGFKQQMNPWTGRFFEAEGYSPSMCVLIDFISRLYGIRENDGVLEWNCRLPEHANHAYYSVQTSKGFAEMTVTRSATSILMEGAAEIKVAGHCRVVTDRAGEIIDIVGNSMQDEQVAVTCRDGTSVSLTIQPNERKSFRS